MVIKMSMLVVGAEMKEKSNQEYILNRSNRPQDLGPQIPIVHKCTGNSMDTMILCMSMGSNMAGTVVHHVRMDSSSMESLWYPRNNHYQQHILFFWANLEDKNISCTWANLAVVIQIYQIMDKVLNEGARLL